MRSRHVIRGLLVVPVLAIGIMGCRGNSEETTPASTAKAGATTAATTASKAATAASTANPKGLAADFGQTFEQFRKAEFKITYEMSGTGVPAGAAMTIAQLKDRSRIDLATGQGNITILELPDNKNYMCMAQMATCLDASAMGALGSNPMVTTLQDFETNGAKYNTRPIDSRRIAGLEARCWEYTGPSGNGVTCISAEGQMLLAETTEASGTYKMQATKVEAKPAASEFELPYPVGTMPGFGGGFGPGGLPTPPAGIPGFPGAVPTAPVR